MNASYVSRKGRVGLKVSAKPRSNAGCAAVLVLMMGSLLCADSLAVTTRFWTLNLEKELSEGELEGVSLSNQGTIALAPSFQRMAPDLEEEVIWCAAEVAPDECWFGTGHEGRIYRLDPKGELSEVVVLADLEILSLTPDGRGGAWAGTGPEGLVFHVESTGQQRKVFDADEQYVWDMARVQDDLIVGVGPGAKLYRLTPKGEATMVYESGEGHVLALTPHEGGVLFGTEGQGLALKYSRDRDVEVIYDPEEDEVRGILAVRDGYVILGYSGSGAPTRNGGREEGNGDQGNGSKDRKPLPPPKTKGKGSLYWKSKDGEVRTLFEGSSPLTLCDVSSKEEEVFWLGTGNKGRIYRVTLERRWEVIAELDASHVLGLKQLEGGHVFACGSSACAIFRADGARGVEGKYVSKVLDAGSAAVWGAAVVEADSPKGSKVEWSTRSGNTGRVDETWTEWSKPQDCKQEGNPIRSVGGRFLQYALHLRGDRSGQSPRVMEVRIPYVRSNLSPRIRRFALASSSSEEGEESGAVARRTSSLTGPWKGRVAVSWEVEDGNEDPLLFNLHYQYENEEEWWPLKKDLKEEAWDWNTLACPDGRYALRLTADDRLGNPLNLAKKDAFEMRSIVVDNTPPCFDSLKIDTTENGLFLKGGLRDEVTPILSVEYCVDAAPWKNAFPEDGLWDSRKEVFHLAVDGLDEGVHVVAVRAVDEAGNVKVERRTVHLK